MKAESGVGKAIMQRRGEPGHHSRPQILGQLSCLQIEMKEVVMGHQKERKEKKANQKT